MGSPIKLSLWFAVFVSLLMLSGHPLQKLPQLTPQRWLSTDSSIPHMFPNLESTVKPVKGPTALARGTTGATKLRASSSSTSTADKVEILTVPSPLTWDSGFGGITEDQHVHHLIQDIQTVMYYDESKGFTDKNRVLIDRISGYIFSEKSKDMRRGVEAAIEGLYVISQNRRLSSYTVSYTKNIIYDLLIKRHNIWAEDLSWQTYFSLDCKEIHTFLGAVLNSGKFDGEATWRFIQKTFDQRQSLEVMAQKSINGKAALDQITNDSWELWIPAFVMATGVTKTHEKELLHLLREFSQLTPAETSDTFLTLRNNEIKIMAQRACVVLAERSEKLKAYYIYSLQESANEVLNKNKNLGVGIKDMVAEFTQDSGLLQTTWKNELSTSAQLNFMTDLRYQNRIHLLVELATSRILEKGPEVSHDLLFKDVLNTLKHQRQLPIPVPDRQMFLANALRKLSQIISYNRPTTTVHPQSARR
ncbi:uncharacterized protein MELLADRAFT_66332 [Melampsora larici-populina 98AG31]|uniref:Secreted protein n=1 Tax=Melampsora larici-populina (strain 98AG31 / pathotype 3-4-7) TaxID=747676 RepID=F4RYS1_MELLP|nr:uncharacterized protein MELLADRAFT_66332 [Melampsora larici-populina 98AG31]EGG02529.1 hypothetical protein MELLADRAFT_66332 [Melampsora larici-populina 98AG31]